MADPIDPAMAGGRPGTRSQLGLGLAIAAIVILADQLTKHWLVETMRQSGGRPIELTDFFAIVEVMNRGVSFGMFNSGDATLNGIVFSLVAAAIVAALLVWLRRVNEWLLALGLVIGGAIGNVADRVRLGAVVDFLDFHLGAWHFPAFNAADSAICVGVALMLIDGLLVRREKA
jgi:signal peptidase II